MAMRTTAPVSRTTAPGRQLDHLLERVAAGDQDAFTALYVQAAARVFGLCRRLVVDHAGAEDLTQEVFVEVWTKSAGFDPTRGSATGWILQIAHHRAVDRIRTAESTRRRDTSYTNDRRRPVDEPDHRLLKDADAQHVRTAIDSLSHLRREALMYAFFTDHSYQQASELLGIPLGTFKSRVRDGLSALRQILAETC